MKLAPALSLVLAYTSELMAQSIRDPVDERMTVRPEPGSAEVFSGVLGARPLADTPFSIETFGAERIESEQQVTANHILRHDPALTNVSSAGGFSAFNLGLRGFPSGADAITFHGMGPGAMFSGSLGQLYSVERLELMKGPSSGLGSISPSSSVGGSVNIVPKLPLSSNRGTVSVGYREQGIASGHLDLNRALNAQTAVRLNLAAEDGKAFHGGREERAVVALALAHGFSEQTRLVIGYDQLRIRSEGYQNAYVLAANVPVPRPPDPAINHFQKWTWLEQSWDYGHASLDWTFSPAWKLTVQGLYGIRRRPLLSSGTGLIQNEAGDMLLRPQYFGEGTRYKPFHGGNIILSGCVLTGPLQHQLTLASMQSGFTFITAQGASLAPIASNLYTPSYVPRPDLDVVGRGISSRMDADTLAFSDDMQWGDAWSLLLGMKNSRLRTDSYDSVSGEKTLHRHDQATTPFAALSYRPMPGILSYLSFARGLERGGVAPVSAENGDEILPPLRNEQYELGMKAKALSGLNVSAALFQITRGLETLNAESNIYEQSGLQRNRGLELNARGAIHERLSIQSGLLLLDPRLVRDGTRRNKKAPGAPTMTLPLTLDYRWTEALGVTASLYHFGKQAVDADNTRYLKAWTRYDAGFHYDWLWEGTPFTLQARVENAGQQRAWVSAAGGQLVLGAPQIWKFGLRTSF